MLRAVLRVLPPLFLVTQVLFAAFLVGCGGTTLADVSAQYVGCPPEAIEILDERRRSGSRSWTAVCRGQHFQCGAVTTGYSQAINCTSARPSTPAVLPGVTRTSGGETPARGAAQRTPSVNRVVREDVAYLSVVIDVGSARLRITGAPRRDAERVWFAIEVTGRADAHRACATGVLVDGVARATTVAAYEYETGVEKLKFIETIAALRTFTSATRVAGRVCNDEWRLDSAGQALVGEFIARFEEELAWAPSPEAPAPQAPASQTTPAP